MSSEADTVWPHTVSGNAGPPVCMLHGFLGSRDDWSETAELLCHVAQCYLPDLPAHGSWRGSGAIPSITDAARQLESLRIARVGEAWHVVGYSMGGRLALHYALFYPASVRSLTLVSASPGIESEAARMERRRSDAIWAQKMRQLPADVFLDEWYGQKVFSSLSRRPDVLNAIIQRRRDSVSTGAAAILEAWGQGAVPAAWNQMREIQCPCQVIVGSEDSAYVSMTARLSALCPKFRIVIVEKAGHTVHLEQPREVAACVRSIIVTESNYENN